MGRDTFNQTRMHKAQHSLALNTSRDEEDSRGPWYPLGLWTFWGFVLKTSPRCPGHPDLELGSLWPCSHMLCPSALLL